MRSIFALLVLLIIIPAHAEAATARDDLRLEARQTRQDTRRLEQAVRQEERAIVRSQSGAPAGEKRDAAPSPKVSYTLSLAYGHTDAEDGTRSWNTPFDLRARIVWVNNNFTQVFVNGKGYVEETGGADGFGDMGIGASHTFKYKNGASLTPQLAFTIPTGGEVGSKSGKESGSLRLLYPLAENWSTALTARVVRLHADQAPGVSRIQRVGQARLSRKITDDTAFSFGILRSQRSGAGGSTEADVAFEFPLIGTVGGSVTYTRGLTAGQRDNSIELEVSFPF